MSAVLAPNPADVSIAPPAGLTTPANPASGQKSQFALFSDNWLQMQGYVAAAVALPISEGDFVAKYGQFDGEAVIKDCIGAMRQVQATSTEFGDPKALRAALINDPNLLANPTPPKEIYSHTVWMGQRVHTTAATVVSGYESVLDGLTGLPSKEQVANLKEYLFDQVKGARIPPISAHPTAEVEAAMVKFFHASQASSRVRCRSWIFWPSSPIWVSTSFSMLEPSLVKACMALL